MSRVYVAQTGFIIKVGQSTGPSVTQQNSLTISHPTFHCYCQYCRLASGQQCTVWQCQALLFLYYVENSEQLSTKTIFILHCCSEAADISLRLSLMLMSDERPVIYLRAGPGCWEPSEAGPLARQTRCLND